ncbi:BrnT family toxin [Thiothrix subterranea]|uniref:BrnT family toxin n=1 Tax=Thiothrix subterranea TaxID=2735563 RepID=UPI00192BF415|nr:BrnT family toxin [Thiothrix subterranea]QQZ30316.1 BrnT family toxin [Thiothrix subterranea]
MEELIFTWDERKRQTNLKKHGIDFADVTGIFYDDETIIIEDSSHYDEQRYIALGMDAKNRVVVVVHVYREEDVIRIISARKADKTEHQQFTGGI